MSVEPEASLPSRLQFKAATVSEWPSNAPVTKPLVEFHTLIVLSTLLEARSWPSGFQATESTD